MNVSSAASQSVGGPHQGLPVVVGGAPLEQASEAMILVHGRGASAESILDLGRVFGRRDLALLAPRASGHTWYPYSFIAPLARNEPGISSGLEAIGRVVDRVRSAGIPEERIVLAGFSQGACLASEYVARNALRWGGLLVFSGGLIGPLGMERSYAGDLDGMPVFMGCSDVDPHIPLERFEETGRIFEGMGGAVDLRVYPGMAHTIVQDELDGAKRVLDRLDAS